MYEKPVCIKYQHERKILRTITSRLRSTTISKISKKMATSILSRKQNFMIGFQIADIWAYQQ
jgi:hypothetical protein